MNVQNVSMDVAIASLNVSLPKMGRKRKGLILLTQMRHEEVRKELPHIFQSCTFNRSVTSPLWPIASWKNQNRA
jgi:hypothetical protein